jgi:dimethylargininase
MYIKAIVRRPGRNFTEGITTSNLGRPDFEKAIEQHSAYCDALTGCGLELIVLEADERYPDGCFVEDTAIVTGEVAVITRPGAASRMGEEAEISETLSEFRKIETIKLPGTLDGGDVLRVENHFFIGISGRTNRDGAWQLSAILSKYGYTVSETEVGSGLHLKSGIAYLGKGNFISAEGFSKITGSSGIIISDREESYSANCLPVNDFLLIPKGFPKSKKKIVELGYNIIELDMSEFRKMDGGLTCLSLLFK